MSELLSRSKLVIKDSSSDPVSFFSVTVSLAISVDCTTKMNAVCKFVSIHRKTLFATVIQVTACSKSGYFREMACKNLGCSGFRHKIVNTILYKK